MTGDEDRPNFALLVDWVDGRLDDATAARVAHQVSLGDHRTVSTVVWLRGILSVGRSMPLERPPASVRADLKVEFARWRAAREVRSLPGSTIVADLFFDSRRDRVMASVRGADLGGGSIHLAYGAGPIDIVVDIRPEADGCVRLEGQVLVADADRGDGFVATAVGPGTSARTVVGDQLGRFCLPAVPDTATELRVSNRAFNVIAALDVRSGHRS